MVGLIGTLVGFVVALAFIFGVICSITGDDAKGNTIIVNCMTIIILYIAILAAFNFGSSEGGVFRSAIPLLDGVDKFGSLKEFFYKAPKEFALSFVELVTLSMIITYLSNLLSFDSAGFWGKITTRCIFVFAGVLLYGAVMDAIAGNITMKWCCYAVEMLITGGAIAYTPLMLAATVTGLKTDNWLLAYIVKTLPKTKLGKAISAAVTSSIMFLVLIVILETQYGSVTNILQGSIAIVESAGGVIVMLMGIHVLLRTIKSHH